MNDRQRTWCMVGWAFGVVATVAACSPTDVAKAFLGGGPNVAANGQIGAENNQAVGSVSTLETGAVEQLVVNNTDGMLIWVIIALAVVGTLGWVAPRPQELWKKWKGQ